MPGTDHFSSAATTASISAPISTRFTRPADSSGASAAAPASAPSRAPSTAPVCTFSPPRFAFASRALQTSPPPFFAAERTFGTLCSRYQLTIVGWRGTRMPSADAMASARDAADPTPWIAPCIASPNAAAAEASGREARGQLRSERRRAGLGT